MKRETRIVMLSGGVVAALLYLACVAWDLLFPAWAMNSVWAPLFPGFDWLTGSGFVLGLLESAVYGAFLGWLIAAVPATVGRMVRG